jgi:hypothetical protein
MPSRLSPHIDCEWRRVLSGPRYRQADGEHPPRDQNRGVRERPVTGDHLEAVRGSDWPGTGIRNLRPANRPTSDNAFPIASELVQVTLSTDVQAAPCCRPDTQLARPGLHTLPK